jgi:DNA uptake protein ComE-like DNA-binding protein
LWPIVSFGLLAVVGFVTAGRRIDRTSWIAFGVLYSGLAWAGVVLAGESAEDSAASTIGGLLVLGAWIGGSVHALAVRKRYVEERASSVPALALELADKEEAKQKQIAAARLASERARHAREQAQAGGESTIGASTDDSAIAPSTVAKGPPDWYPDPKGEARLRYWDGSNWTEHTDARWHETQAQKAEEASQRKIEESAAKLREAREETKRLQDQPPEVIAKEAQERREEEERERLRQERQSAQRKRAAEDEALRKRQAELAEIRARAAAAEAGVPGPPEPRPVAPQAAAPLPSEPKLDANSASEAQLAALEEIGPGLARRIVEIRESRGPFASIDELASRIGLRPHVAERIRDRLTTEAQAPPSTAEAPVQRPPGGRIVDV